MKKALLFFIVFVSFSRLSFAQYAELGLSGGAALYSGDLAANEFGVYFEELNPAFGLFGRFNVSKPFSIRIGFTQGKLTGDDNNVPGRERGLNFKTDITDLALTGEFNFLHLGQENGFQLVPYLTAGVAAYFFNPKALVDGEYIDLQPIGTEGQGLPGYEAPYRLAQVGIPIGAGLKFIFNKRFTLGVEFVGRKLFTDYLDDVSGNEVNYLDILEGNGQLAAQLSNPLIINPDDADVIYKRGGKFTDWYYFGMVTISFNLGEVGSFGGRGTGCPTNF
ncbi:MAG: DUF6089 family protein [Saprospiraceae bacterium]